MTPQEWIVNGQVGVSSKTIWCVMQGIDFPNGDIPHDPDDFSRCYKLLEIFPEWKQRMNEVAVVFPKWIPLVKNWDYITELYEMEKERKDGRMTQTWHLMNGLSHACYIAGGWVGGNGSYRKEATNGEA